MHHNLGEVPDTDKLSVHVAINEEGSIVGELAAHAGFIFDDLEIDWSTVFPYWLLCCWEGKPVGTLQICPGHPVGRAEIMGIDPTLGFKIRTLVARQLITAAATSLKMQGSQFVSCLCPDTLPEYRRILEGYGGMAIESGSIMIARIP